MIGKRIAEIRKQRGYTLSELADLAKISKSYLSNIERNLHKNPSLEIMIRIADVLNVELAALLNPGSVQNTEFSIEQEWVDFVSELKEVGMEKDQLKQYKLLIEFIKWQNERSE
ncbi:MAG: transcriptional regulator SinR [Neobacillus sp.]|jgi:XRE family transcriptional regulator, master regulator for biofilm formation|nr:transcriptional regulator SinR [Neobacillus sp.]